MVLEHEWQEFQPIKRERLIPAVKGMKALKSVRRMKSVILSDQHRPCNGGREALLKEGRETLKGIGRSIFAPFGCPVLQ